MAWHARLSASGTKQWLQCPGSAAYIMHHEIPGAPSGMAAMEGTAAHFLIEECLRDGHEPVDFLNRMIEVDQNGKTFMLKATKGKPVKPRSENRNVFIVDEDMVYATTQMTDYVRRRVDELGVTMNNVKLETRVHPLGGKYQSITGGTGDVIIEAWPEVLEIVDYKHGRGVYVPVEDNPQAMSYMLGAMREVQDANNPDYVLTYAEFRYTICQPRHLQAPSGGISSETKTAEELLAFRDTLQDGVDRVLGALTVLESTPTLQALDEASYLSTGQSGDGCTFCPLKVTKEYGGKDGKTISCPAILRTVQSQALIDFSQDSLEAYQDGSNVNQDALKVNRPADELATVLPWLGLIEAWAKDVRLSAEARILAGETIQGYKVVEKKGRRSWKSDLTDEQIVKQLTTEFRLGKEDIYGDPKLLTGPQIEKLLDKKVRPHFNDKMLSAPEPEKVVVPESDKRPAVEATPGQDFANLKE